MFLFRLKEKIKDEHVEECLNLLIGNESLSKCELEEMQIKYLKELLLYLYDHNPYYSQYIKANEINIKGEYNSPYDLIAQFPVIDKSFIKQNYNIWLSKDLDIKSLQLCITSGSSGVPFKFYHSQCSSEYKLASKLRLYHRFGIKPDDLQLCFGPRLNTDVRHSFFDQLKIKLNNRFILKKIFINTAQLEEEDLRYIIDQINKHKIKSIWCYPSVLFEIAKFAIKENYCITNRYLKAIIYSGEGHSEYMDQVVRQAFPKEINILNEYNCTEGFIAGNCRMDKMHLNEDVSIFEVMSSDGKISQYGKGTLLVTHLFSKDFPFIRYNTGDIVDISEEKCSCGMASKVLKSIDGRSSSFIYNGDEIVPHTSMSHCLVYSRFRDKIDKFQIIQNERDSVIVKLVLSDKNISKSDLEAIYEKLFNKIKVNFEYVDQINHEVSGKFRDVIQNIKE